MKPFDILKARSDTPGCEQVLHLNNAGAALMPQVVVDAVSSYMQLETNRGGYEAAAFAEDIIAGFYAAAAALIHAHPAEIAYIENATRAWDMVFYSLKFKPGDRIVTSQAEYASNYIAFLQVAKRTGAVIDVIPDDDAGQLSLQDLAHRLDSKVRLLAITHVPTQGGLINPAEEVGRLAKQANVFYLLDATQSIGQMPIDVEKIGCSALCATGRKFLRAPRGTGFLFVSQRVLRELEPPFLDLHAAKWISKDTYEIMPDARRFETWETSYANKIGLATAIDYALHWGMDTIWSRIQHLALRLRQRLTSVPGLKLADLGRRQCGIVTFTVAGRDPRDICLQLRERGINVSVSLQEYARLDLEARGIPSLVRASVHYYNTEEEIERFGFALEELLD